MSPIEAREWYWKLRDGARCEQTVLDLCSDLDRATTALATQVEDWDAAQRVPVEELLDKVEALLERTESLACSAALDPEDAADLREMFWQQTLQQ